ncbi:MAG TPA: phosphatidate cytidylyltransferase [Jatrophihabitans sp.]|nr:phosphatidate cytidylyltransferase [Jatrophihabitans sp.]
MTDTEASGGRSAGRHGGEEAGESGLSAADLIARARSAAGSAPPRPSRRARRAEDEASTEPAADQPVGSAQVTRPLPVIDAVPVQPTGEFPVPAQVRHLTVVPAATDQHPEPVVAAPPVRKPPRGGRNLPAAIGVGAGLGALIVATLTLYRPSFVFVIVAAVGVAVAELVTAIATVEARPSLVPLLAGAGAMEAAAWFRGPDGLVGAFLLTVLGLLIWRLADGAAGYLRDVGAGALVALYVPFLAGFATLLVHAGDGAARIILFVLVVVCSDTGGYAVGVLFGRHPMAPMVSPKKSWEGLAGSAAAGSVGGVLMMTLCFHHAWWQGMLFGLALVVTATLGDLGESMIKRDLGLKDMGRLLPGHGGIMDRLDSLLPCAPVAYLLLSAFLR